jgi:hypothetical protein
VVDLPLSFDVLYKILVGVLMMTANVNVDGVGGDWTIRQNFARCLRANCSVDLSKIRR